ncbi:hypothetical protein SORBI_3009G071100 [Sorghum bicolor]|uniref:Acid phosphatase n=1 Tax=Sorghum bicolor TaxID=4558 RepID=A0A1Z5R217_SORBI|nr:hypothetical protein SORBI_3009G071100 [Sorghum bicolor]
MAAVARLVLLVAALMATGAAWDLNMIRLPTVRATEEAAAHLQEGVATPLIHALHPLLGSAGDLGRLAGVPCDSWRLAVEAYNKRDWKTVPANCKDYAIAYAEGLKLAGNGKEVWVFDVDETSLSTFPYYAREGFGYVHTHDTTHTTRFNQRT